MELYTGVVENRDDPLKIGRCQVRIVGIHTENKSVLPTEDLPWAYPMQPVTSAAINGIGWTPTGPVPGTWVLIIFRDQDQQQPIMLGTLGGIPQSKASELAKEDSDDAIIATSGGVLTTSDGTVVTDGEGNPIQVGTYESTNKATTQTPSNKTSTSVDQNKESVPGKPSDAALKSDIPTKPPANSTKDPVSAERNINLIIKACDEVGLTSKYAKCAILGIVGGESGWLPTEEGYYYTKPESLAKTFKRTFKGDLELAAKYTKWQGSREDFFRFIYSPSGNGSLLGHKDLEDGAKYYGRGFNQITGKSLYLQMQNFLKSKGITVDLINNPESLISDPWVTALCCAAFYSLNVKHNQNDPGYFVSARARTGADANGTGYAKKQKYYEYFLGGTVEVSPTNKPEADSQVQYNADEIKDLPPSKQSALTEDRSDSKITGFKDPSGKYPLRNLLDEPDTNRLARGVTQETCVEFKDSVRSRNIPAANDSDSWDQPLAPFGGVYPYSKVYESESGHLFVMDDSPGKENVSLYHRKGTFLEIDANGTQVNKIIGDGYTIIDRNGSVYIQGKANLTVGNGINVYVQGSADIQVDGQANINLKNNASIGVGGDLDIAVGNSVSISAGKDFKIKAGGAFAVQSAAESIIKSGEQLYLGSDGDMHLSSSGNVNMDGAEFRGQEGSASSAPEVSVPLTAPEFTIGNTNQWNSPLVPPVRAASQVDIKQPLDGEGGGYNSAAASDGVNDVRAPQPIIPITDGGQGEPATVGSEQNDILLFLRMIEQQASQGVWTEIGMKDNESCAPSILRMWNDIGLGGVPKNGVNYKGKIVKGDQVPWCAGFVNWCLKQCGHRWAKEARAFAFLENPARWGAIKVESEPQPGDVIVWEYSHVSFVYEVSNNGTFSCIGGNQGGKASDNNPVGGLVTVNYKGTSLNNPKIKAVYRIPKGDGVYK